MVAALSEQHASLERLRPSPCTVEAMEHLMQQPQDAGLAARVLGAAEAEFQAIGAAMWPADRLEHQRTVAAVRGALGEAVFATAWAEGRL